MKLVAAFVLAALSLPFGTQAFAQSTQAPITRTEIRQQLIHAEADGLLPSNRNDYPPSASEIARNRQLYAIQHHDAMPTTTASTEN
ncbi:hypothetical protein BBJ41_33370 [Burkholderia stabilis]|uniref:DUF4148 domain-containing protein n=1 Tax=Burkholderia stabilis TaxID=95485 RepID=UPI000851CBF0|nr:DUF4148 domain-containing protein [Burkholderia stabilis]AOR72524.1 hypothetical protein BBJ41_33370 [Burkholderia stabilis]HDR9489562.1 DUF4148 domain-containing protein [Burkholderia stabilis]HDR9536379.1 DUF4148 domain-containing protein [Burkholderia stabilis]HDR9551893.1 DUF4148 domain-containing protein [Burkholderia stabilis]HDR9559909.1 DUF4148 domain-containing protein [Burkholderia stabilis]